MGYPMLAFETETLEIISRQLGQSLCAKNRGQGLIAFRQFGVGGGCARVGRLKAQCPFVNLAAREIVTFGFLDHLPRTRNSARGSNISKFKRYSASGPMT